MRISHGLWALVFLLFPTSAAHANGPLVLPKGRLRLSLGPPDLALLDSGYLGEGRGLRVGRLDRGNDGETAATLGMGLSYGIARRWELGVLALPLTLAPNTDYGDLEMHTRFAVTGSGVAQLALQAVLQFPTQTEFGLGLGMPLRLGSGRVYADTGLEIEMLFGDYDIVNLDVPFALNVYVSRRIFLGGRSGLFLHDFDHVHVPLGFQLGGDALHRKLQIVSWFLWPAPPWRGDDDTIDVESFQFGVGLTIHFDVR